VFVGINGGSFNHQFKVVHQSFFIGIGEVQIEIVGVFQEKGTPENSSIEAAVSEIMRIGEKTFLVQF
jgi:hypothetical protein